MLCKRAKKATGAMLLFLAICQTGRAAPLFPDVPDHHWSTDAVRTLATKGLVEGYPDGTFKGDRAASRWEVAMVVARLLAKMEQEQATFATKAELDELRKLVNALREELEALGVRVGSLEESVGRLDQRVTELERITFYGFLETRVVMQSFRNDGVADNDSSRLGAGAPSTVPYLNYNALVGTRVPATFRPQVQGVVPVVDYRNGRALTNGTGFSSWGVLGVNMRICEEIDAGMELAAYSSQGDAIVDGYWGVSAPYLSNPFTALAGPAQGLNNVPFTKMTLDHFWVAHKPSKTRLTVGAIPKTEMSSFVYAGQPNVGVFGPKRWPGYGFQVSGRWDTSDHDSLTYEVMGSRFGDNARFEGVGYLNYVLSGCAAYRYNKEQGKIQLDFARIAEEAPTGGGPLGTGWIAGLNTAYGASTGWSVRQWVNPPGYYLAQLPASQLAQIGTIGNTADTRPVTGWSATADNAIGFGPGAGDYGPQSQQTFGISANHRFDLNAENRLVVGAEYGHSQYRPNRNSPFESQGDMLRAYLEASLLDKSLDLGLEYLSIDPTYNPAAWPNALSGIRFVDSLNFTGVFHLHDFSRYPHNREGFRANAKYSFAEGAGQVYARAAFLEQTRTSLYDVRVTPDALGLGTPNFPIIGFAPGFVDPIFYGFAHPAQFGPASANSFTDSLQPLENPRGQQDELEVGFSYKLKNPALKLTTSYKTYDFRRQTSLSAALGGSQNQVSLSSDTFFVDLAWEASPTVTLSGGVSLVGAHGHYDPAGLYNGFALATGSTDFPNIDSEQTIPHLAVDWKVSKAIDVNLTGRYYSTCDKVDPAIGTGNPALGQIGSTTHPFSWEGLQLSSDFKVKF